MTPLKNGSYLTGEVPFKKNDGAPIGTEHTVLVIRGSRKLFHFIEGGDNETKQSQKENMFIQMCEGLHESENRSCYCIAKDKRLHQVYKGLSKDVVKEGTLNWDDNYMIPEPEVYPQDQVRTSIYKTLDNSC